MSTFVQPKEQKTALGLLAMAAGVCLFTMVDTSAKWLILFGLPALQVIFMRYAGALVFSLLIFIPKEGLSAFKSNAPRLQILRAAFLLSSTSFNFMSLRYLPITLTTAIMFAAPIIVTVLAMTLLGEKVGIRRIVAVCVGFIGVLVVVQPWGEAFHPAIFMSIIAISSSAGYFIMTRKVAGIDRNSTSQLWCNACATLVVAPFAVPIWIMPNTFQAGVILLAIGAFAGLGHICVTFAHRLADASILAPVVYTQVFLASAAGILVFDTWPTIWTLWGSLIIIASGIYIWHRERISTPT